MPSPSTHSPSAPVPETESLMDTLRSLPAPVWILCLGTFLNKFGSFVIPFLALYMAELGFSTKQAGVAIGAYGVGHLGASAVGGLLADKIGRRRTAIISMVSAGISMLWLSQARTLPEILVLSISTGFCAELYRPACSALMIDLVPPTRRVTAFAAYRLAFNAGWAFGPATAGLLAKFSFQWLFIGDALTSFLFAIVAWRALPRDRRSDSGSVRWGPALQQFWRDPRFIQVLGASLAIAFVFYQMSSTYSLHVTLLGFSAATYGKLISLNGVLVVLLELPLTTITKRYPARRMMAFGYVLIGLGFGLNAVARDIPFLVLGMSIFTLGEMLSMPVTSAYIAGLAPEALRGRYMGLFGLTWSIGLVFGPAIGMVAFETSPSLLWWGCTGLGLAAAGVISMRSHQADEANRKTS